MRRARLELQHRIEVGAINWKLGSREQKISQKKTRKRNKVFFNPESPYKLGATGCVFLFSRFLSECWIVFFVFAGDEISMSSQAVFSLSGEDALITCMVRPEDSSSSSATRTQKTPGVIWAKLKSSDTPVARRDDAPREILAADTTRVTADRRFNVIRDEGESDFRIWMFQKSTESIIRSSSFS